MTDIADGGVGIADPPVIPDAPTGKQCAEAGCPNVIPGHGEPGFHPARKLCDEHYVGGKGGHRERKAKRSPGDTAPGNVDLTVNLGNKGGGKTAADKRVLKVTNGATAMAQTFAVMLTVGGDPVCGKAIAEGAEQWGKAIGDLSRYQPILEKIFAPTGEVTGQGMAWLGVIAATCGIVIPVMAHHKLISPDLANKFAGGMVAASGFVDAADAA